MDSVVDPQLARIDVWSQIAVRAAVVFYSLGLFISNAYYSRYTDLSFSIFKARYILIGATFTACLLIYMYVSSLVNEYCSRRTKLRRWSTRVGVFIALPLFDAVVRFDEAAKGTRTYNFGEHFFWEISALVSLMMCSYGLRKFQSTTRGVLISEQTRYRRFFLSPVGAYGLLWTFLGLTMYSYTAFPNQDERLGGAQMKVVFVHIRPERRASILGSGLIISDAGELQPLRLLTTDSDSLVLLSPPQANAVHEVAFRISKDAVDVVRFEPF